MFLLFVFVCMLVCTWVAGARPDLAPSVLSVWDGFIPHAYEVDHIRPVSRGGTNDFSNLRALCRECHGKVSLAAEAAVKINGLRSFGVPKCKNTKAFALRAALTVNLA